jgi:probable HAF family extracellular repeat protein
MLGGMLACQEPPTDESSIEAAARPTPNPVTVTVLDLGTLDADGSFAFDVNDDRKIVGAAGSRAYLHQNGVTTDLGLLPGMTYALAQAINAAGTVVGSSGSGSVSHAFVWSSGSAIQPLAEPAGSCCSDAQDINTAGLIVGSYRFATNIDHALMWISGTPQDIHVGPAGSRSIAFAVNDAGRVVGTYWADAADFGRPFSWTAAGGFILLTPFGNQLGEALDIDGTGRIVGWGGPAVSQLQAYLLDGTTTTPLGTLGGTSSVALSINGQGEVVGRADKRRGQTAFAWSAAAGIRDLGLPRGSSFGQAWAINNNGWIVGQTTGKRGRGFATLWQLPSP